MGEGGSLATLAAFRLQGLGRGFDEEIQRDRLSHASRRLAGLALASVLFIRMPVTMLVGARAAGAKLPVAAAVAHSGLAQVFFVHAG